LRGIEQIPWLYDFLMALAERGGLGRWRRHLVGRAAGRTLDLGCGTGRNLVLFAREATVFGLELEIGMLRRARQRAPHTPLVVGRAEDLPFRDRSFDTVISSLVFCSIRDPRRALDEIRRVISDGGRLRMLEHVRSALPAVGRVQDLIQPLWTRVAGGCHPNRDTESSVEDAGFVIEERAAPGRASLRYFAARLGRTVRELR
jgi:ubiquinone/menaquinone biosynthesis C-methylase UbiE